MYFSYRSPGIRLGCCISLAWLPWRRKDVSEILYAGMVAEEGRHPRLDLAWVGGQLRAFRERRGASQAELARRTGIARTYLVAMEQGRHEPSLELLARIAAALDYPLPELVWSLAGEPFADPAAPLAARVRLRRRRLGLRAAELAARAGTTRATISQIEAGVNANPSVRLLARLARALECCPSELAPPRPLDRHST
jgi:transcriptional regulator with XRE-family HTH domain